MLARNPGSESRATVTVNANVLDANDEAPHIIEEKDLVKNVTENANYYTLVSIKTMQIARLPETCRFLVHLAKYIIATTKLSIIPFTHF